MKFYLYILFSQKVNRWYIGSSNNIQDRLRRHNAGESKSTKPYRPWTLVYYEVFLNRSGAMAREMFLKSPKGYNELLNIKKKILISSGGFA